MTRKRTHIFTDFDGTITSADTLIFLTTHLGGGAKMIETLGRLLSEGEISLRDAIAAEMRSIRAPFATAAELLRREVTIDPGFAAFAQWTAQQQIPLTILSAGFQQLIEQFVDPAAFPHIEILANRLRFDEERGWQCEFRDRTEHGHDKAVAIQQAKQNGFHTIFIGDGYSDQASAAVADEVFAKHALASYCRKERIRHDEFNTFAEVLERLQGADRMESVSI